MIAGIHVGIRQIVVCDLAVDGLPSWRRIEAPEPIGPLEAARLLAALSAYEDWPARAIIGIEQQVGLDAQAVADLARVIGVLLGTIPASVPVCEIAAGDWKAEIGLRGKADKEAVKRWARDRLRSDFPGNTRDLDGPESTAYAIATVCRRALQRGALS
jgi:hypothetical protein